MKMEKYRIKEICSLNKASLKKNDLLQEIIYLDTSNITENKIDNLQLFSISEAPSRAQRKVQHNTILFSTVRPNQNHFGILKSPQENLIVSSGFTTLDVIDENQIDSSYLYFKLTQPFVVNYLQTVAQNSVSAYPSINPDDIGNLLFEFPELDYQQKIAVVLSSLDDKIAMNNRINAKLESMAKRLYDYWFVQFDFPNEDGKPYKSNGGKMVWNEELKREIPVGWAVNRLGELAAIQKNQITPEADVEYKHYSLPSFDECESYSIEKGEYIFSNKFLVKNGDLLISKLNPWTDRTIWVDDVDNGICSTEYVVLNQDDKFIQSYLNQIAHTQSFINYCTRCSTGTSHSHRRVNPDLMIGYKVPFSKEIIEMFGKIVFPIIKKKLNIKRENRKLIKLRDEVLPLLMNGQVVVE